MEEAGDARINDTRFAEAAGTGADTARRRVPLLLRDARRRGEGGRDPRCGSPTSRRCSPRPPSGSRPPNRRLTACGPCCSRSADAVETFGIGPTAVTDAGAEIRVWDAIHDEPAPALDEVSGVVLFGSAYNIEHADEQPFIDAVRDVTLDALDRGGTVPRDLLRGSGARVVARREDRARRRCARSATSRCARSGPRPTTRSCRTTRTATRSSSGTWTRSTCPTRRSSSRPGTRSPHQAFRIGDRAWATQFHFEIDRPEIDLWIDDAGESLARDWHTNSARLRTAAIAHQLRHEHQGTEVFRRFVKVARAHA